MLKSVINCQYRRHDCKRICLGDIFKDFVFPITKENEVFEMDFPFIVILSQECDISQGHDFFDKISNTDKAITFNQYLPNILIIPAWPSEQLKAGEHLIKLYKIKVVPKGGEEWKNLIKNKLDRFHFLSLFTDFQVPNLILDFKIYYSVSFQIVRKITQKNYVATINEIFREKLSQRFSNYFSRIGTPDL